jgi:hypothetical protein
VLAGRLLTHGNDKRLGPHEAYWVPYAPLQFGQAYRPSISYGLAGRAQEASWTFRTASDPFLVQPTDVVVAKWLITAPKMESQFWLMELSAVDLFLRSGLAKLNLLAKAWRTGR